MKRIFTGTCVFTALFAALLLSQDSQNKATLSGTITDPAGVAMPGVRLELRSAPSGALLAATSDAQGRYSFANLSPGEYDLSAELMGFKRYSARVAVPAAGLKHDIQLEVGAVSETMSVSAGPAAAPAPRQMAPLAIGGGLAGGFRSDAASAYQVRVGIDFDLELDRLRRSRRIPNPSSEEYGHWVENEFASPNSDPLSTFGVDVDTASYANIRRFLNENRLPPTESVRIEELVNYFTYDYPLPDRGKPVSLTTHVMTSPWNPQRQLLHIGLRTQPIATEDLPPTSLTFLIDVSGSMNSPDKLPLVQQALSMLVRQLRSQDRVAMVVYAGSSGVVLPTTAGDQRDAILQAIDRLQAGGSTHGSAGIRLAYQVARDAFLKEGNNRVILATDGDFNVGVTSDAELVQLIENERKSGIFLSVLGFGTSNLKDSKMEKLADHGNGNYAYIDSLSEARKVFVQEMGATVLTVAKDVKLQIEFNPARVSQYRLIGYENRLLRPEDFNDDTKDAGDLGAGHQVTAFYEIVPAGSQESGVVDGLRYQAGRPAPQPVPGANANTHANELAWIKLRYKAPQSDESQLLEWPVASASSTFEAAPREVRFAAAVAEYGMLLRHSKFAGQASYAHALSTATSAVGPDLAGHRTAFLDLVRAAARLSGQQVR